MAASRRSVGNSSSQAEDDDAYVYVFDRREKESPETKISTGGLFSFIDLKKRIKEVLRLKPDDNFVIATTNREEINSDETWDLIDKGDTLYLLRDIDQELCAPAHQRVSYLPHYDTIVKGGMYEYYASEGQNPLPYAFAELIDNALAATSGNIGSRNIEIRMHLDDSNPAKNSIYVIDNGKGMTPRQLNNWAIYRLSKFNRKDKRFKSDGDEEKEEKHTDSEHCPLSLNSDISYFGVGGKQAIFFIGNSTRMITKPSESKDVHELSISKEEFQQKEKNQESIYSGFIRNRKPGDCSHVGSDDEVLKKVIAEETSRPSFTVVEIHGINPEHNTYLKQHFRIWTRQLAHIYHYYVHGPNGNEEPPDDGSTRRPPTPFKNINIEVKLFSKGTLTRSVNLRDVDDDMQTQFIRSHDSTFAFKAVVEGSGVVEGLLRYHPFLYDKETYPPDANDPRAEAETFDEHDYAINERPARGRKPMFECYWNGRLIPYTFIDSLEWCAEPKKSKNIPIECYNRLSGVLFANDHFQVSTNKLTFIDLEMRLREKNTVYTHVIGGQEKRTAIDKEFTSWLKSCHEHCDKQIFYTHFKGLTVRHDLPKQRQSPWSVYEHVEWDGKIFKKGQMVRILRTTPVLLGTITRILLFGDHEGNTYATGGDLEIIQEPRSLYDDVKVVPLSRLDRFASQNMVKKNLEDEEGKLPTSLIVTWPDGNEVKNNEKRPAGKTIGDIKVQISNQKGEFINKLPGTIHASKKLLVELKVTWHSPNGDEVIVSHISQHGKNWPYWFRKMENIKNLGNHTLLLQAVLNESGVNTYYGKNLPSHKLKFTVTEAAAEKFSIGMLVSPFRVGLPFQIPLDFHDEFNNPSKPNSKCLPELEASGLKISYGSTQVKGTTLILKDVVAVGAVGTNAGKNFTLIVKVPGLEFHSQTIKISLLPGNPHSLSVKPETQQSVENGSPIAFTVEVHDEAGNITTGSPLVVTCKFQGASGLPTYSLDCSASGTGVLTGDPVVVSKLKSSQKITAKIEVQGKKEIAPVERTILVLPSNRVASLEVFQNDGLNTIVLKHGQTIKAKAGELVSDLGIRMFDEAGRKIEMTDAIAGKLKVNWTPRIIKEQLMKNQLPDVKVPATVSDVKYCQVSVSEGSGVEFSFIIKPIPKEPNQMKCKCMGSNSVQLRKPLESEISIAIKDKFGNEIIDLPKNTCQEFHVSADGLVEENVKVTHSKGTFILTGIQFEDCKAGMKDVKIEWRELHDFFKLDVLAGPPCKICLPDWDLDQTVTVLNDNKLPRRLVVQLLDEDDNVARVPNIRVQMAKDPRMKVYPALTATKTNVNGCADFGLVSVSGPQGSYDLQPKVFFEGSAPYSGPKLSITIQPDLTRPVEMKVDYNKKESFHVGKNIPEFTVKIIAEDGEPMHSAKATCISLKMWRLEGNNQKTPPSRALSFTPELVPQSPGVFVFKDCKCPEQSGIHNILVTYYDGKYQFYNNVINVDIKPGSPVKLSPAEEPGTPTVSNTQNPTNRCLIKNLKFNLQDSFGNSTGLGHGGKILLEILSEDGDDEVPSFAAGSKTLNFNMSNGSCQIANLTLSENSGGKDGAQYILRCNVMCPQIPKNKSIPPLDIPFLFYNDAKKQSEMASLTKQKNELTTVIKTYKSLFDTTAQLVKELKLSLQETSQEENKVKEELRKQKFPLVQLSTLESVNKLIDEKTLAREKQMTTQRRLCTLSKAPTDKEILGKIGHLAQVEGEDIARVLSWHMSADMDCVVTLTSKKAQEVYKQTGGKQQVLPLDSIYKKTLPDWQKPLPHLKYKVSLTPKGHPVYARNLLIFPENAEQCRTVFGMLLGDTLILDNLTAANEYRQELVKYTHCPTILTREGDRIRSNGKFGGLMNKALSIEKLRGAVFGEPVSSEYHRITSQIELLQKYKVAIEKRMSAKQELDEQTDTMKQPEMQVKHKECREAESQLKAVEHKLGITMNSPRVPLDRKRHSLPAASETNNKRSRSTTSLSSSPVTNGNLPLVGQSSSVTMTTPTRQSSRLRAQTSGSEDAGRKRLKRT